MTTRYSVRLFSLLVVVACAFTYQTRAQRVRAPKVTSLQATVDKAGPHPATAEVAGAVPITCLNAVSETPNGRPAPSCHITAPGFKGDLNKGQTANATGAGTVTLTCNGQGMLRCAARIN